ncbi:MAG: nucleoside-diphosphate kinase [Candidatus Sericytochromatia bacterium]|nr:nucleoside-diphosphate kinase [Candidatus Sericytochromatia bacterium]
MERTFVAIKPDGVQRRLIGELINRFERRGLSLVGLKLMNVTPELAQKHYAEHSERPFFKGLVAYITSGPIVAMAWEGKNAAALCRQTIGATKPEASAPGTIRADFAVEIGRNLVHGSDSPESGARELALWFKDEELVSGETTLSKWIWE